jgi:hypothetical protein
MWVNGKRSEKNVSESLLFSLKIYNFAETSIVMDANEKIINTFVTRVRQLMLQYEELKKENARLLTVIDDRDASISLLQEQLKKAESDYQTLKTARMLQVSDRDMDHAKRSLASLIRDVNKCITMLSSESSDNDRRN